ncbi:MAG: hypothetical protein WC508_04335 [Patescibacteria group bacterium]
MSIKKINLVIIFTILIGSFFLSNLSLAASTFDTIKQGFAETGTAAGYPLDTKGRPANEFGIAWVNYINGMLTLMGLLFMVNIIYAGYIWMTARGQEDRVKKAQTLIIQAVIGLSLIIGARLIVEIALSVLGTTIS